MTTHITKESETLDNNNLYTYIFSFPNNIEQSTAQTIVQNEVAEKLKNTKYKSEDGEKTYSYLNNANYPPKVQVMIKDNKYICKIEVQFSVISLKFV